MKRICGGLFELSKGCVEPFRVVILRMYQKCPNPNLISSSVNPEECVAQESMPES